MRKLLCFLLLVSVVACKKTDDDVPVAEPMVQKIEWQVHASDTYTNPWLDSMTAQVEIRIYKSDTLHGTSAIAWDTIIAPRTIRQYPVLPQKQVIEKEVSVRDIERLQTWYNIRYEMNGTSSEMGHLQILRDTFTFVDIKL